MTCDPELYADEHGIHLNSNDHNWGKDTISWERVIHFIELYKKKQTEYKNDVTSP